MLPSIRQYSEKLTRLALHESSAVQPQLTVLAKLAIVLENIEHSRHLREDENTRPLRLHRLQEFVKDDHLTSVGDDMLVGRVWWPGFL